MLPSELHFTVCTHSSVFLIFVLCVSAFPSGIRERLCPEMGQTMDHGLISWTVTRLPSSSFTMSLVTLRHPSELAEDGMARGGQGVISRVMESDHQMRDSHIQLKGNDVRNSTWDLHARRQKEREEILNQVPFSQGEQKPGFPITGVCWLLQHLAVEGCSGCTAQQRQSPPVSSWDPTVVLKAVWGHFQIPEEFSQGVQSHPYRGVITNSGCCFWCWCGGMRVGEEINNKQKSQLVSVQGWK